MEHEKAVIRFLVGPKYKSSVISDISKNQTSYKLKVPV